MIRRECLLWVVLAAGAWWPIAGLPWAALAGGAGFEEQPSWYQFHGPHRDNLCEETGLLRAWPEQGPKLLWTARGIGHGFATVSIADGRIYTAGNIDGKTVVSALDTSGKLLWQTPNGPAWEQPVGGARGTPTIDAERVYHESPFGQIVCLDAATGKKFWELNILERFGSKPNQWGLAESLLIDGDRLYCRPGGPQTCVVALDKMTGRVLWKSPSAQGDLAGYSSMILVEQDGLRMLLTLTSRALIGVNAENGDLLWRFPHQTRYNENICTPIYRAGEVFVSTPWDTGSVKLRVIVEGNHATVEPLWRNRELNNHHGGVVLVGDHLYGSAHRGRWMCVDWKTGRTIYTATGVGKGSVLFADGMLYTFSEKGEVGLVPATPEKHEVTSRFRIPPGGEGPCWAHPVIFGGRLYLRHGDCLYCYDIRAR